MPVEAHFHALLRACIRAQRYGPRDRKEQQLRVALSAPPSMLQLGLPVTARTLDLVLHAHTAAFRIYRAVHIVDEMYDARGLAPSQAAFDRMLKMSVRLCAPRPPSASLTPFPPYPPWPQHA